MPIYEVFGHIARRLRDENRQRVKDYTSVCVGGGSVE